MNCARSLWLALAAFGCCFAGDVPTARAKVSDPLRMEQAPTEADAAEAARADAADGPDIGNAEEFEAVRIAGPFEHPWSIGFLTDGAMVVTERPGRLNLIRPGGAAQEIGGLRDVLGAAIVVLLDVVVAPDFPQSRMLYLSYGYGPEDRSTLRVARVWFDPAAAELTRAQVIFESAPAAKIEQYGGRMALADDGHLFITLGDRWERDRAQDLSDPAGSIVRIRSDGSIPEDNPFVGVAGARPEIWSYGHRNPLGIALDRQSGRLWAHENGPLGGDELNLIHKGSNYGWPVISHGLDYSGEPIGDGIEKEGMEQPFHAWLVAVAPSGLAIERQADTVVFWIGALAGQALIKLEREDDRIVREKRLLHEEIGRIRDVRLGPDGFLYVVTDDSQGGLYRLDPVIDQAAGRPNRRPL